MSMTIPTWMGISLSLLSNFDAFQDYDYLAKNPHLWEETGRQSWTAPLELLHGLPSTKGLERAQIMGQISSYMWDNHRVRNGDDLKARLYDLLDNPSETCLSFENIRSKIRGCSFNVREQMLTNLKGKPEYNNYLIVNEYDLLIPLTGIRAYDFANASALCRLGMYQNMISEDEGNNWLQAIWNSTCKAYTNVEQFALSSAVGLLFENQGNRYEDILRRYYNALHHPQGYWSNLEWTPSLI